MIVPVAVIALVLPNYTTIPGPILSRFHRAFFGVLILLLYGVFLTVQTVRHPYYFKQPEPKRARKAREAVEPAPVEHVAMFHTGILVLTLLPVVYLTEALAELTGIGLGAIGAPAALAGVIIAVLVLSPEGMGALRASSRNELQRAINISLGSALATVGLDDSGNSGGQCFAGYRHNPGLGKRGGAAAGAHLPGDCLHLRRRPHQRADGGGAPGAVSGLPRSALRPVTKPAADRTVC